MLFQALDNKKECYAIYCEGELCHYPGDIDLSRTWSYSPHFKGRDIEYAQIWAHGADLTAACPEHLKDEYEHIRSRASAFLTSFKHAKINLDHVCFYDLVPKKFLLEFCEVKNKITDYVFEHTKKPKNYDFMVDMSALVDKIATQELNLQLKNLDFINPSARQGFAKIKNAQTKVKYNLWGTTTGRLSTHSDSFPILTLNRNLRSVIHPQNDLFVELDYNSAEIRTLLSLMGDPQPEADIHEWARENIFDSKITRAEAKKKVFAWLYNPNAKNKKLSNFFDKHQMLKKYYIDGCVSTPYNRTIEVEPDKALNYLIQSTASDMFLRSVLEVDKLLAGKKTKIAFLVHDSVVLDVDREDKQLLEEILSVFSDTSLGRFKANLSMGRNFGNLKEIK